MKSYKELMEEFSPLTEKFGDLNFLDKCGFLYYVLSKWLTFTAYCLALFLCLLTLPGSLVVCYAESRENDVIPKYNKNTIRMLKTTGVVLNIVWISSIFLSIAYFKGDIG